LDALGINGPFLIAQIVNFTLLLLLLRAFLYKPVLKMLETRKQRIADGLQAAEVARREAEVERGQLQAQLDSERRDAMERIAAASKRGETLAAEIEANARQEGQRIVEEARNEAARERERILAEAQHQIAGLSMAATEKVLSQTLDASMQRRLIDDFLANLGEAKP